MSTKDLSILGLQLDRSGKLPTAESIKKAYRLKALQLHPDKNPDAANDNNSAFLELQGAYENLTSPQKAKNNSNGEKFYSPPSTYHQQHQGQQRPRSPAASTGRSRTPNSSTTRPPFSTKPASKFSHQQQQSPLSPKLSNSATRGVYFNSNAAPNIQKKTGTNYNNSAASAASSSTTPLSSSSRRTSNVSSSPASSPSMMTSPNNNNSSNIHVSNPKSANFLPGTVMIPPPFENNFSSSGKQKSLTSPIVVAPFPAFLPNGQTYNFETDPSAFGIYSNHLRHGDTAKVTIAEVQQTFVGIVIGVAADGNLYWWRLLASSSSASSSSSSTMDSFATFLAPRIPANATQQANTITVVKQAMTPVAGVPLMNPLHFSNNINENNSSSNIPSTSSTATNSSSTSTSTSAMNWNNNTHQQQQMASSSFSPTNTANSNTLVDIVRLEEEERKRKLSVYDSWRSEAVWCCNLPFFASADSARFTRVLN